jgi:class 3 adenylate cyclase
MSRASIHQISGTSLTSTTSHPRIRALHVYRDTRDTRYVADPRRLRRGADHVPPRTDRGAAADAAPCARDDASSRDSGRFLTTVLMTDIVDSTLTVARLGDRRWRELLAEHYVACRELVERNGGKLVSTTGDGIVAIFDSPTRAIRAAIAAHAAARASGIAIRAGVHTGECERLGDGLAGVAVHIAARVCALGSADEVMTTGTVRDLVTGSMLAFEPRGRHELKGVPGDWTVFTAVDPA